MPVKPHRARQLVRLVPVALAAYELHSLLGAALHAGAALHWLSSLTLGSALPWLMLALALGAGALLRESARGLLSVLALGALLAGTLGEHLHLLTQALGPVGWTFAIPAALLLGLALADLAGLVHWLMRTFAQSRARPPGWRPITLPVRRFALTRRAFRAPLLAGPTDRGPPTAALAAALSF